MQRALVERARSGDLEAFTQLVELAFPRLKGVAYLILRDPDRAEDAVQDALVAAWQDLRALRDPDAWDAWLRRLLVRTCYRLAKKDRRHAQVGSQVWPDPANARSTDTTADVAERAWILDELGRIDLEKRAVIVLHYYLDLPMREVAEIPRPALWDRRVPSPPRTRTHACIDARRGRTHHRAHTGAAGMNDEQTFERSVVEGVSGMGPLSPSAGAIDRTITRARSRRQRPRWLALIKEPPMRRASRLVVGSPTARVAAIIIATLLVALVLAAAAVAGSRLLTDDNGIVGNGPIIVAGRAYDPYTYTGETGPDPCNCTTDASWSADGQRVAFRRSSRIYVTELADPAGELERQLADCSGCDEATDHISMAADGGSVAFTDAGDVWLADVETGTRTQVTDLGKGRRARAPTIAPEGDRLAFVIDDEPGIWVIDLAGGEPWQLTTDAGDAAPFEPAWSPDGRTIAYVRQPGLDLQLWSVDVATGEPQELQDWPGCCMTRSGGPTWSPDGRELAVVATDQSFRNGQRSSPWFLWVVAADGSTIRNVGVADPVRPAWRPVPLTEASTLPVADAEDSPMPA